MLELRQQLDHLFALARHVVVVVVVDQQRIWIFGTRGFECGDDEVDAGGARVDRIAQQTVAAVSDRFVHHVPHGRGVGVPLDDGMDVSLNATQQRFARHRFAIFLHHPPIGAVVLGPHEAVANDFELVGTSELDEAIGVLEVPPVFGRMNALRLHAVLGRENLEVLPDQGGVFRILHDAVADADADFEAVAHGLLQ